jgi:SAM-dependent methyltransferase
MSATPLHKSFRILPVWLTNWIRLRHNAKKNQRQLEIGPGNYRLQGFESLNILSGPEVDYVCDATKPLPFPEASFDLIYSSHTLEHVPWYLVEKVLKEWVRILKKGGALEIWVPDGLKIAKAFVEGEEGLNSNWQGDGWYRFNEEKDVCKWVSGRIFTYGDGTGNPAHPNWHRAIFSPRFLEAALKSAGLVEIRRLTKEQVRGYDHGWINLGMSGQKP